jgi:hypothetical protein
VFVTSQGSAYARFRRALAIGNLTLIRSAAAELPRVDLPDALRICVLLRGGDDPAAYQRAVIRWLGRLCLERPDLTVEGLEYAVACFRPQFIRASGLGDDVPPLFLLFEDDGGETVRGN